MKFSSWWPEDRLATTLLVWWSGCPALSSRRSVCRRRCCILPANLGHLLTQQCAYRVLQAIVGFVGEVHLKQFAWLRGAGRLLRPSNRASPARRALPRPYSPCRAG